MSDDLRSTLIALCEQLKSQHTNLAMVMCDCVALRSSLLKDPETVVRYEEAFAQHLGKTTELVQTATQLYDQLIEQLKNGASWVN
jgi:hypothetical protein